MSDFECDFDVGRCPDCDTTYDVHTPASDLEAEYIKGSGTVDILDENVPDLATAGVALARARQKHSEAFLRYKTLDPKRTDGVARAMADQDVDLTGAEVDWEIAKRALDTQAQEFELKRLELLIRGSDASQSTTGGYEEREDTESPSSI